MNYLYSRLLMLVLVIAICFLPMTLVAVGILPRFDKPQAIDLTFTHWGLSESNVRDEFFYYLQEAFIQIVFEWVFITLCVVVCIYTVVHYQLSRNLIAVVVGMITLLMAVFDAVGTLILARVFGSLMANEVLVPFLWELSGLIHAGILCLGSLALRVLYLKSWRYADYYYLPLVVFSLALSALFVEYIKYSMVGSQFISMVLDNTMVNQFFPMLMFAISFLLLFMVDFRLRSILSLSLMLSVIPAVFYFLHFSVLSSSIYDTHFYLGFVLKNISVMCLMIGLVSEFKFHYRRAESLNRDLVLSENRAKSLFNENANALLVVDKQGEIREANKKAVSLLGDTSLSLTGTNLRQLIADPKLDHDRLVKNYFVHPERKNVSGGRTLGARSLAGVEYHVEVSLAPLVLAEENLVIADVIDVSNRVQLEDELLEKNRELDVANSQLRESNESLKNFAYSCSHDLQEPVRMVNNLSAMLLDSVKDQLDDFSLDVCQRIQRESESAQDIISGTLKFCLLDNSAIDGEKLPLLTILKRVDESLTEYKRERRGSVSWSDNLPSVKGGRDLWYPLILNLVSNGLKFNQNDIPTVAISYSQNPAANHLFIDDNGIGIPQAYREQVFGLYTRLEKRSVYEGSGLGLAIVKRITDLLGMSIAIADSPLGGTRFTLTLPAIDTSANKDLKDNDHE